ncbi:glutathione_peroxidase [Hexamita inflata]|uniref:Glutathione peroxidase n=2 Tax=Hexamita inflata TaxID=28002 RepID=A0AA86PR41_9EUKA|nr:glutathione peroxidase [Hexamita inflata]CAI9942740.1 glutathione peroxidase [Hexamita inflata]CAI9942742.1 glutathione peroxidase [Hexamita inflata]
MSIYDFKTLTLEEQEYDMAQLKGKVVLIVNVASKCGLTPQYKGLQQLYLNHKDKGLAIVGFPCNQFASQEPGDKSVIQKCQQNFGVSFQIMSKIDVNGDNADPIYKFLKQQTDGEEIKWNFGKFLINREGKVVKRFAPTITPEELEADILNLM